MASTVQSVAFARTDWTVNEAKRWLRSHDFEAPRVDRTKRFYRFRQQAPDFDSYATKTIYHQNKPIDLVLGFSMRSNPSGRFASGKAKSTRGGKTVEIRPRIGDSRPRLRIPTKATEPLDKARKKAIKEWKAKERRAEKEMEKAIGQLSLRFNPAYRLNLDDLD